MASAPGLTELVLWHRIMLSFSSKSFSCLLFWLKAI